MPSEIDRTGLDAFLRSVGSKGASRSSRPSGKIDRTSLDAFLDSINDPVSKKRTLGDIGDVDLGGYVAPAAPTGPSFFQRALDVISRPLYGVQNVLKDWVDEEQGTENPLESFWAGLSGVDKTTFQDVLSEHEQENDYTMNPALKGILGFTGDVLLDPTTYTTFGIGKVVTTGAKAAAKKLGADEAFKAAVKKGEVPHLEEYSASEIKSKGGKTPGVEEQAAREAARVKADADEAVRLVNEEYATTRPESSVPDIQDAEKSAVEADLLSDPKTPRVDTSPSTQKPLVPEEFTPIAPVKPVVVDRRPSTERYGNDFEQARRVVDLTQQAWRKVDADPGLSTMQYVDKQRSVMNDVKARAAELKEQSIRDGQFPAVKLGDNVYPIHASDVFDSLGDAAERFHLSKFDKVPTSSMIQGAAKAVEGHIGGMLRDDLITAVAAQARKANKTKTPLSESRARRLATALVDNVDTLAARMVDNEARMGRKDLVQGTTLGDSVADQTAKVVNDPMTGSAATINAASDVTGNVSRQAKDAGMSPGGTYRAAEQADRKLKESGTLRDGDTHAARATEAEAKASRDVKIDKINRRKQQELDRIEKQLYKDNGDRYVDLSEAVAQTFDVGIRRAYNGLRGFFVNGMRMGDLGDVYRGGKGFVENEQFKYGVALARLNKKYDEDTLMGAFTALQSGMPLPRADDLTSKVMQELKPLLDNIWDPKKNLSVSNIFTRNGFDMDTVNAMMDAKGLSYRFKPDPKTGSTNMSDIIGQMDSWKITDLTDSLSKLHSSALEMVARKEVMMDFARRYGSTTRKPGMVKIAKTNYESAPLSHFVDHSLYYPREYVEELRRFNNIIDVKTNFKDQKGGIAWFSNNVLDRYLRLWKPSVTIFRLGHHIRNFIGDGSMNYMYGVKSPKHYARATSAMRMSGKFDGDLEMLDDMIKKGEVTGAGKTMFKWKGSKGEALDVTPELLWKVAYRNGTLVNYRSSEDLLRGTKGAWIDKTTDKLMESKPAQLAGALSENSVNLHKLAQLSYFLEKHGGEYETLTDAVRAANKDIWKYHPDIGGLAKGEAKYGRRVVPFYTWMRQAVPVILNTALHKPGRLTIEDKASYNTMMAMGMDPKSYSEPYTDPSAMPAYMREYASGNFDVPDWMPIVGGHRVVANLGMPSDTLADILSHGESANPIQTVGAFAGEAINPLATLPMELFGQSEITGKYVADRSEQLDAAIPFVNQLASLSGYSPTGTVGNILSGGGENVPFFDPQRVTAKGEKDFLWNQNLLNWVFGLGIQQTDRPSQQRTAIKENRG